MKLKRGIWYYSLILKFCTYQAYRSKFSYVVLGCFEKPRGMTYVTALPLFSRLSACHCELARCNGYWRVFDPHCTSPNVRRSYPLRRDQQLNGRMRLLRLFFFFSLFAWVMIRGSFKACGILINDWVWGREQFIWLGSCQENGVERKMAFNAYLRSGPPAMHAAGLVDRDDYEPYRIIFREEKESRTFHRAKRREKNSAHPTCSCLIQRL
jgi:hypothetical protein